MGRSSLDIRGTSDPVAEAFGWQKFNCVLVRVRRNQYEFLQIIAGRTLVRAAAIRPSGPNSAVAPMGGILRRRSADRLSHRELHFGARGTSRKRTRPRAGMGENRGSIAIRSVRQNAPLSAGGLMRVDPDECRDVPFERLRPSTPLFGLLAAAVAPADHAAAVLLFAPDLSPPRMHTSDDLGQTAGAELTSRLLPRRHKLIGDLENSVYINHKRGQVGLGSQSKFT